MFEPQAPKTPREIVRDTFTPPRVGLLSWAFAALVMGTIGLASYQFGSKAFFAGDRPAARAPGLLLPPQGAVETTASLVSTVPHHRDPAATSARQQPGFAALRGLSLEQSQIEVLQKEVVGLRRRLMALSEQNMAYSRRIAALEAEIAVAKPDPASATVPAIAPPVPEAASLEDTPPVPRPGAVSSLPKQIPDSETGNVAAKQATTPHAKPARPPASPDIQAETTTAATSPKFEEALKRAKRKISLSKNLPPPDTTPAPEVAQNAPVRIISQAPPLASSPQETLPDMTDQRDPGVTGAIHGPETIANQTFDSTPTRTTEAQRVLSPSSPSGKIKGGSHSAIQRSDFGAVIGHYPSHAAAAKAWADFKEQNEERMHDLRPLLLKRQREDAGIALMIGPFANAADASIACLHLLAMTELCRPALYAGDPLTTTARIRDTVF